MEQDCMTLRLESSNMPRSASAEIFTLRTQDSDTAYPLLRRCES